MSGRKRKLPALVKMEGQWTIRSGAATYDGPRSGSGFPYGICKSELHLAKGSTKVNCRVEGESCGRVVVGISTLEGRYVSAGLGGYGFAYVISEHVPSRGWRALALTGDRDIITSGRTYELEVLLDDRNMHLVVDGVPVLKAFLEEPLESRQLGLLAWGSEPVWFSRIGFNEARKVPAVPPAAPSPETAPVVQGVGSPFGFGSQDWDLVAERKRQTDRLYAVLGYQFESDFYDTSKLTENVGNMLRKAVGTYNETDQGGCRSSG